MDIWSLVYRLIVNAHFSHSWKRHWTTRDGLFCKISKLCKKSTWCFGAILKFCYGHYQKERIDLLAKYINCQKFWTVKFRTFKFRILNFGQNFQYLRRFRTKISEKIWEIFNLFSAPEIDIFPVPDIMSGRSAFVPVIQGLCQPLNIY